jgi:hypothetical protein
MNELLEAIRAAVADQATAEHKAAGAQACRTILAALEAEAGKPLGGAAAPPAHPLAGLDPTQALDLLIARLRAALPKDADDRAASPADRGIRIALVTPPPGVPWKKR